MSAALSPPLSSLFLSSSLVLQKKGKAAEKSEPAPSPAPGAAGKPVVGVSAAMSIDEFILVKVCLCPSLSLCLSLPLSLCLSICLSCHYLCFIGQVIGR